MFVVTLPKAFADSPRSFALRAKKAGANLLEIRGDKTPSLQPFRSPLPLLVAPRGQGIDFALRLAPSYIDLDRSEVLFAAHIPSSIKLIISMHDDKRTPDLKSIKKIVQKMYSKKYWMLKIVTTAKTESDLRVLRDVQTFMNKKSIQNTVLALGPKGHLLRVLSPYWNRLTYSCISPSEGHTTGQLPLSFYQFLKGRKKPTLFGIIGGLHISSSYSPLLHNALFQKLKIDALYTSFPTEDFQSALEGLRSFQMVGYSVTAPYKRQAFRFADTRETRTDAMGTANTLVKKRGRWNAFNSDFFGILEGYPELSSCRSIAILGAGGVVPAVIEAVRILRKDVLIIVCARNMVTASKALKRFHVEILPMDSAPQLTVDAVICAITEDVPLLLPKSRTQRSYAIDLRYLHQTRFLLSAGHAGFLLRDGVSMLIAQALRQCEYFTGKRPKKSDAAYLRRVLRTAMIQ